MRQASRRMAVIAGAAISGLWLSGWVVAAEPAGATVTVTVNFEGTPPPAKPIKFGAEKQCSILHTSGAPTYEDVVVNKDGTLKWVVVYVKEGLTGTFKPPTDPVVFDQLGCVFKPHVAVAQVGQAVEFRNGDALLHNVRGLSKQAQSFNIAQPVQGMKTARVFKNPEVGMLVRCDVHFWMTAYLHVLTHPFFGVTGDDGTVAIRGLPAGTYTLEIWHEKLGVKAESVTVQDGDTKTLEVGFGAS